jgi:hypothetical protein
MDWDPVVNELIKVVLLAFFVERALAVIYDMERVEPVLVRGDLKPVISVFVSIALCYGLKINVVGVLAAPDAALAGNLEWLGIAVTGLVVAGGSAGAVKLFQDVLGFRRSVRDEAKQVEQARRAADTLEAQARAERAQAQIAGARAAMMDASARLSGAPLDPEEGKLEERIAERELKIKRGV